MSVVSKLLVTATKLAQAGQAAEAARRLQENIAALTAKAMPRKSTLAEAAKPVVNPFSCFGPPSSFDFSKGLQGFAQSAGLKSRPSPAQTEGGRFETRAYSGSSGKRSYKLFVPVSSTAPRALVLMLHGCTQTPDDFAAGTRMNALGQQENVLVAYPEQTRSANSSLCWNWFEPKDQRRDAGEPAILAGIARDVVAEFGVGAGRVFVAGLSAGGAMAAILAETYPDLFAAVGIHSGLPYGAAHDIPSAFSAMSGSAHGSLRADETGVLAHGVPVIVFQGDADRTVHRNNADAIVGRIHSREAGLRPEIERGTAPGGRAYLKTVGRDASGTARFEHWTLVGAGHAWSGGSATGTYTDPLGPDASAEMMRFFLERA